MNSHYQRWQFVKYGTFTRLPVDFSASAIHCLRKLISLFGWLSVMSLSGGNNCQSSVTSVLQLELQLTSSREYSFDWVEQNLNTSN